MNAGGDPCTLRAIANIGMGNRQQDRLALELQCGSITCPQASPSSCNDIHDALNIGKLIYKQLAVIIILSFYRLFNEKLSDREDLYSLRVSTQHLCNFNGDV